MGDKSPKAKERGDKQKKEVGKKDAASAKAKQDKQGMQGLSKPGKK